MDLARDERGKISELIHRPNMSMIPTQHILDQRIVEVLKLHYGIVVNKLTPLLLGADMHACTYKALTQDHKSYLVKLKCGHQPVIGIAVLDLLHAEGIQNIIQPLKSFQGQPTQRIEDFTLIVYPFIESKNGFQQNLTADQWVTLGKVLKKVHACKIPSAIQDRIRKETYSPKWRDAVRSFYGHLEAKPSGDEAARKLLTFMKAHKDEIHRLVDTAELLSQKMLQQATENVLCHADIHGGNVLIDKNGSIYIVDWDDPVMAPKERDLMFIGGGVANVWNNPHEERKFYEGYGKTEVNQSILAYYRHERIVEDIAEYAQALLATTVGENRLEMYKHFVAMFELRGVVDIAFRTS